MVQTLIFVKKHKSELISIQQEHLPIHKVLLHRCHKALHCPVFLLVTKDSDKQEVTEATANTKLKTQTSNDNAAN